MNGKDYSLGPENTYVRQNEELSDQSTNISENLPRELDIRIETMYYNEVLSVSINIYERISRNIIYPLTFRISLVKDFKFIGNDLSKKGNEANTEIFGWSVSWKFEKSELSGTNGTFKVQLTVLDKDEEALIQKEQDFTIQDNQQ